MHGAPILVKIFKMQHLPVALNVTKVQMFVYRFPISL